MIELVKTNIKTTFITIFHGYEGRKRHEYVNERYGK